MPHDSHETSGLDPREAEESWSEFCEISAQQNLDNMGNAARREFLLRNIRYEIEGVPLHETKEEKDQ